MNQLIEFFKKLFDSSDWPARWNCGRWTDFHGWLYIISDLLIWSAYFSIPLVIVRYITKKQNIHFGRLYFLFAGFILACGTTHLLDAIAFWNPAYRLSALVRFITGLLSWTTVFYLVKLLPVAFSLKSQKELETEIEHRIKAEEKIKILNAELEQRVAERTEELNKSEKKYRYLFENNPMPMWIFDLSTFGFLDVNEAAIAHYGYSREEFLAMTTMDIRPLEEKEKFRQMDRPANLDQAEYNRGVWKHVKKDGTVIYAEIMAHDIAYDGKVARIILSNDVTEKVKYEEELRRSMKEIADYKYALDESSILAITDQKGVIRHANENFCMISKQSADELIGRDHPLMNSEFHSKDFIRNLWVTIANGKIWRGELKSKAKDGTIYWVDTTVVPFVNEAGKPYQHVAISTDITERKQTEQALHENQQLLSAIIENSTAVIYVKNLQGQYLLANRRFAELFHLNMEDIPGKTDYDFFPKDLADAFRNMDVRTARADHALTEQELAPHDDGAHTYISVKSALRNENGKPYAIFGISTDITQLKTVEENLRKSLRETSDYKFALDESSIVAITDQKGIIKYANDNFCKISKYSHDELIGQDHRIINSGYHSKEFIRDLWTTIANGNIWRGEIKNKAKDGTIYWVATTIVPFLNEEGKPYQYVAIRSDITEKKRMEDELHQINEELEKKVINRTDQLQSANKELESFSYSVSHDLRAPLRIINGFGQMLLEDYAPKLDEEAVKMMHRIMNSAHKMGLLIDNLLNFSRLGRSEIRMTNVNMNHLVDEVLDELKGGDTAVPANVKVNSLKPAKGDSNLMKHVWMNLISNAIKYSSKTKEPYIEIGMQDKEDEIIYYVKDNGVGFDMKYKHKLFGVFQRLHYESEFAGTGVGLALVQRIIFRHGGTVWAEAKLNEGATFYFTLPK